MDRVQTLTDKEYKILLAVREASAEIQKTAQIGSKHLKTELESIYYDLQNMASWEWEEVTADIERRLHQLLH